MTYLGQPCALPYPATNARGVHIKTVLLYINKFSQLTRSSRSVGITAPSSNIPLRRQHRSRQSNNALRPAQHNRALLAHITHLLPHRALIPYNSRAHLDLARVITPF